MSGIEEKLLFGIWLYSLVNACVSGDLGSNYIFWAISLKRVWNGTSRPCSTPLMWRFSSFWSGYWALYDLSRPSYGIFKVARWAPVEKWVWHILPIELEHTTFFGVSRDYIEQLGIIKPWYRIFSQRVTQCPNYVWKFHKHSCLQHSYMKFPYFTRYSGVTSQYMYLTLWKLSLY